MCCYIFELAFQMGLKAMELKFSLYVSRILTCILAHNSTYNMLWHMALSICATHLCHAPPFVIYEVFLNFPTGRGCGSLGAKYQLCVKPIFWVYLK